MAGKFFDEWQIGETITHEIRRTVTETDNLLFTTMTHNPQPLHLDIEAALRDRGVEKVKLKRQIAPAWSTDWISAEGREKLLLEFQRLRITQPRHDRKSVRRAEEFRQIGVPDGLDMLQVPPNPITLRG